MKIRFLKDHGFNKKDSGTDAPDAAANYLIRVGVAEEVKEVEEESNSLKTLREMSEKEEKQPLKEKKENKTGNVPTAKKRKVK